MASTKLQRAGIILLATCCALIIALGFQLAQKAYADAGISYSVRTGAMGETIVLSGEGHDGDIINLPTPDPLTWTNNGTAVTATFAGWRIANQAETISYGRYFDENHLNVYVPSDPYRNDGHGGHDIEFEPELITSSSYTLSQDEPEVTLEAVYLVEPYLVDLTWFRNGKSAGTHSRVVVAPGNAVPAEEFDAFAAKIDGFHDQSSFTFDAWRWVDGSGQNATIKGVFDKSTIITSDMTVAYNWVSKGSTEQSMYRLYNPNSGEHFYTSNATERSNLVNLGWQAEGIGWKAPTKSNTPVYRMYNPNAGDHHYTPNASERDMLKKAGWNYEGIGWYSDDEKATPLYRLYNPNAIAGSHHYTTNATERDNLRKLGWSYEGVGWYGE